MAVQHGPKAHVNFSVDFKRASDFELVKCSEIILGSEVLCKKTLSYKRTLKSSFNEYLGIESK